MREYDEVSGVGSDSDDGESLSSDADQQNHFFDLEASEEGSDAASEGQSDTADVFHSHSFPQFMRLPMELREMVWKAFCPDLDTAPRVFEVHYVYPDNLSDYFRYGVQVESQVRSMRTLLAVHRESRFLGLKFSPDRIEIPGEDGFVPCSMNRDIIYLTWDNPIVWSHFEPLELLAQVANGVQNVAIALDAQPPAHMNNGAFAALRSLKNVFVVGEAEEAATRGLAFCVSGKSHEYHIQMEEMEPGLGEDLEMAFCWPNPEIWGDSGDEDFTTGKFHTMVFDGDHHLVNSEGEFLSNHSHHTIFGDWGYAIEATRMFASHDSVEEEDDDEQEEEGLAEDRDIKVWPMARFVFEGIERLEQMKAWKRPWDEWESEDDSDDSPDEYESDGIDDEPIDDFIATDDEDDLPPHLVQLLGGSPDLHNYPPAQFSSESEDQDPDGVESSDEAASRGHSARSRPHVVESSSEDESATVEASSRSTSTRPRPGPTLGDSDDDLDDEEDGEPQPAGGVNRRTRRRAAHVLSVDSEDDVEDVEEGSRPGRAIAVLDSDEDEDGGESERRPSRSDVSGRPRVRKYAVPEDSDDEPVGPAADLQEAPQEFRFMKPRAAPNTVPTDSEQDLGLSRRATRRARAAQASDSDSEDKDGDEDSSDEEPPPPKRMSLAKRLQIEHKQSRAARPAAESDEEGSAGSGGASDDDEGEDEDTSDGDGIVMGMAEEGEEDEEADEEGIW